MRRIKEMYSTDNSYLNNSNGILLKLKRDVDYAPVFCINGVNINYSTVLKYTYWTSNEKINNKLNKALAYLKQYDIPEYVKIIIFNQMNDNIKYQNKLPEVITRFTRIKQVCNENFDRIQRQVGQQNIDINIDNLSIFNPAGQSRRFEQLSQIFQNNSIQLTPKFRCKRTRIFNSGGLIFGKYFIAHRTNNRLNILMCLVVDKDYIHEMYECILYNLDIDWNKFTLFIQKDFDTPKTQSKQMRKYYRSEILKDAKECKVKIVKFDDLTEHMCIINKLPQFPTVNAFYNWKDSIGKSVIEEGRKQFPQPKISNAQTKLPFIMNEIFEEVESLPF